MSRENESFKINVTGKMYIGDLCYALDDDVYHGVWGANDYKDDAYKTDDGEFAMVGTAFGDGSYGSTIGFEFPVDAGIIGICDGKLVKKEVTRPYGDLGLIVDAVGEASIEYDEDGTITVTYTTPSGEPKSANIYTGDDDYDDENYEDEDEEDYEDEEEETEEDEFNQF